MKVIRECQMEAGEGWRGRFKYVGHLPSEQLYQADLFLQFIIT